MYTNLYFLKLTESTYFYTKNKILNLQAIYCVETQLQCITLYKVTSANIIIVVSEKKTWVTEPTYW